MSDLATKQDLEDVATQLCSEIAGLATLAELAAMEQRMSAELAAMEQRMSAKTDEAVRHTTNVMMEQIRTLVNVVKKKYEHLPADVAALRRDFDEHRSDLHLHTRPLATLPKRATKKMPCS